MPGFTVAVVARSELFACGMDAAFDGASDAQFGVRIYRVPTSGPLPDDSLDADVILLEWSDAHSSAWAGLATLRGANPSSRLLLSTLDSDAVSVRRFVAQGVDGIVLRSATGDELHRSLVMAGAGETVWPSARAAPLRNPRTTSDGSMCPITHREAPHDELTARQAQTVRLICAGMSNSEIAAQLHVSVNSVKSHIRGAYRTMGVATRSQAVLWGLTHGYGGHEAALATVPPSPAARRPASRRSHDTSTELEPWLAQVAGARLEDADDETIREVIVDMIEHPQFPCLGARSVVKRNGATIRVFADMTDAASLAQVAGGLARFAAVERGPREFASFVTVFRHPSPSSEAEFERLLWTMLQQLHDADAAPWAARVSADPAAPDFSFSLGGVPFFIVGLHPAASRIARRTPLVTVVFNLHDQFEQLRADGAFDRMRDAIRRRDAALQGTINPVVTDHGRSSEARQYSGRHVEDDWCAPFTPHSPKENPHD